MANFLKWRIDFVKLAAESNPTEGVENGSTCYEVDTGKLYIYYKGTWYEQDAEEQSEETPSENTQDTKQEKIAPIEEKIAPNEVIEDEENK